MGDQFVQQLLPLRGQRLREYVDPSQIRCRPAEAADETKVDRIAADREYDV